MQLRIGRDQLAEAVAWVARALPSRPVVPILAGMLLDASETGGLTLSCFDYEVSARVSAAASIAEPGRVLVSGRLLGQIARSLPQQPVDLAADGDNLILTCGSARFTLLALPAEDYPALPALPPRAGTVDGGELATAVSQVAVAAGRDETLPMLTGILVEIQGPDVTLVATDRYRMAVRELGWQPAQPDIQASVLVPARTLAEAAKTMTAGTEVAISLAWRETTGAARGGAGLGAGEAGESARGAGPAAGGTADLIGFDDGGRRQTARLLGTEFVTYKSRFPREPGCRARVTAGAFAEAIRRVALVADRESRLLLTFGRDEVAIETGSSDGSRAVETMAAGFDGEEGFAIAFKPQYLLDGVIAAEAGARAHASRSAEAEGDTDADGDIEAGGDAGTGADGNAGAAASAGVDGAGGRGLGADDRRGQQAADGAGVTLEFTTPDKPAVITASRDFRYLLAPMRT
jgi:DNA polymerase III subunit beta